MGCFLEGLLWSRQVHSSPSAPASQILADNQKWWMYGLLYHSFLFSLSLSLSYWRKGGKLNESIKFLLINKCCHCSFEVAHDTGMSSLCISRAYVTGIQTRIMSWGLCHRHSEPDDFLGPVSHLMDWFCDGLLGKLFIFDIFHYFLNYLF